MQYDKLSSIELDALKEIFNVGVGNAATSLSIILSKKIDISVPSVNVISLNDLIAQGGENEVVGIVVRALGDISGSILLVFLKDASENILKNLMGSAESYGSDISNSAFCEIGNIIATSYMNSIAQLTGLNIMPSVPAIANDMLSAILTTTFIESNQYDEYILDIETIFLDDKKNSIGGHFYYIPMPGSLEKILKSIGIS